VKPFQSRRIDGQRRYSAGTVPKRRSKRANGNKPRGFNGNSAEARRIAELVESFAVGIPTPIDEPTLAIVRGAALMAQQLERIEERVTRGHKIDEQRLLRLSGAIARAVITLNAMKPKASDGGGPGGITLEEHLAAVAARRRAAEQERQALEAEGRAD
jgi:hypothetical protein